MPGTRRIWRAAGVGERGVTRRLCRDEPSAAALGRARCWIRCPVSCDKSKRFNIVKHLRSVSKRRSVRKPYRGPCAAPCPRRFRSLPFLWPRGTADHGSRRRSRDSRLRQTLESWYWSGPDGFRRGGAWQQRVLSPAAGGIIDAIDAANPGHVPCLGDSADHGHDASVAPSCGHPGRHRRGPRRQSRRFSLRGEASLNLASRSRCLNTSIITLNVRPSAPISSSLFTRTRAAS